MSRDDNPCQISLALDVFGGKWKGVIIYWIKDQPRRFNELKRLMPNITQRTLTNQLRDLERDGLIKRTQFNQIPPRVEYSATNLCRHLIPLLDAVSDWGRAHQIEIMKARESYDQRKF